VVMPSPKSGESKKSFINRCIPYVIKEGGIKSKGHAYKKCEGIYDQWRKKHKGEKMDERVLLRLRGQLNAHVAILNEAGDTEICVDRTTMLVGDGTYNGIFFPADEVEKSLFSWDSVPIVYDHSDSVKDAVGDVTETHYDKGTKRLTMKPVIDGYPESENALKYIRARQNAGAVPEVSVGVYATRKEETLENGETRVVAKDLRADHLALVSRGACSPEGGCGVGLKNDSATVSLVDNEYVESDEIEKMKLRIAIKKLKLKEEI